MSFQRSSPKVSSLAPSERAWRKCRSQSESFWSRPICIRLMLSTPPTSARSRTPSRSMPPAATAAVTLDAQASTTEKAGTCGSSSRIEPDLARDVAPAEIRHDRAPHREVGQRAGPQPRRHRLRHRHRQLDRVIGGQRAVDLEKGVRRPAAMNVSCMADRYGDPPLLAAALMRFGIYANPNWKPMSGVLLTFCRFSVIPNVNSKFSIR